MEIAQPKLVDDPFEALSLIMENVQSAASQSDAKWISKAWNDQLVIVENVQMAASQSNARWILHDPSPQIALIIVYFHMSQMWMKIAVPKYKCSTP